MEACLAELSKDPARHRTRILVGVGALGLLGGSLAFARHFGTPEDSCARVDRAMNDAWGAEQRQALERAFRSEAKTYAEQSIERVEGALEGYAARWVEERRVACEAAKQVGTEQGRAAGLSAACLDQRLRRFEALVELFGHADQSMVVKAMSAVQELPDPSQCRDGERYREAQPLPEDAAAQAQVESLRLRMSEIHLMAVTGQLTEAEALLPALLDEARAQDFDPVLGEALLVHGGTKAQLGKYDQAQASLEEGLAIARSHGLEQLEADLLSPLIFINTAVTSEFALADWQARTLEILVVRLDPSPTKKATVLIDRARLERTRGRYAEAIELGERAIELFERDEGAEQRLVLAYDHLATAYMETERYDDAARILERAEELAATALGPDHPHRGNLLAHSARVEAGRGNNAASAAKLRAALQIFEGAYGGYHPNVSAVLNGLALQLEAMGRSREAVTTYHRAQELVIQAYGEDHAQVAIINANLGNALRRSGDAEEALRLHRSVRMLRERNETEIRKRYEILDNIGDDLRVLGRCDEARIEYEAANELRGSAGTEEETGASYALLGMGLCQWQQRDLSGAQQTLERALAIARGEEDDDQWSRQTLALVRASMAMVLHEREASPERVEVLAKRARAFWATRPEEYAVHVKELDAWRAGGPARMPTY